MGGGGGGGGVGGGGVGGGGVGGAWSAACKSKDRLLESCECLLGHLDETLLDRGPQK